MTPSSISGDTFNYSDEPAAMFLKWGAQRRIQRRARRRFYNSDESTMATVEAEANRMTKDTTLSKEEENMRPWNLRKRRAKVEAPGNGQKETTKVEEKVKFSLKLSKKEIENDVTEIWADCPPRRLNKRPRYVKEHLDTFFPGLLLTQVASDFDKVVFVSNP